LGHWGCGGVSKREWCVAEQRVFMDEMALHFLVHIMR
jgi:hypothetical protein